MIPLEHFITTSKYYVAWCQNKIKEHATSVNQTTGLYRLYVNVNERLLLLPVSSPKRVKAQLQKHWLFLIHTHSSRSHSLCFSTNLSLLTNTKLLISFNVLLFSPFHSTFSYFIFLSLFLLVTLLLTLRLSFPPLFSIFIFSFSQIFPLFNNHYSLITYFLIVVRKLLDSSVAEDKNWTGNKGSFLFQIQSSKSESMLICYFSFQLRHGNCNIIG